MDKTQDNVIDYLERLFSEIEQLQSYEPSPRVNFLFTSLVHHVLESTTMNTLSKNKTKRLQELCAKAEYELERYWAKRIIDSDSPREELAKFPYIENYYKLTHLEWYSLRACLEHELHEVLFIGGGPLPLSAIVLAEQYGCKVTVVDIDEEACELSRKTLTVLGLDKKVSVVRADARSYEKCGDYSVIAIAALAGVNGSDKVAILSNVKNSIKPHTHILTRSSWGARELLYPPVRQQMLKGFDSVVEIRPQTDIVNSVLILKEKTK